MSERKPVLAMVTDSIQPFFSGGKEVRCSELSQRLSSDFDVHVYTMKWWTGPRRQVHGSVTFHGICPRVDMYVSGGRRSIPQALIFALGCLRLVGAHFDVLEADHMPYLHLFVLRLVCWMRRRRMVVTWHEVWGRRYWQTYLGPLGHGAFLVEWLSMRLPDAILAASDQTASRLRELLGTRKSVHSAPNGLDLSVIRGTAAAAHEVDIVTVGRLLPHKRVDLLLQTVAHLGRTRGKISCRIIGTGPERDRLTADIERLGIADVELLCEVAETRELFGLVKAARVFVLPSEREGFGIAALEGIACGLPVVTTSAPDNLAQYLVASAPGGIVCEPTVESLAEAIENVLTRGSPAAGSDAVDHWIRSYTWPAVSDRVSAVLHDALPAVERGMSG